MPKFYNGEQAIVLRGAGTNPTSECEIIKYRGGLDRMYMISVPGIPNPNRKSGEWFSPECLLRKKPKDTRPANTKVKWKDCPWQPEKEKEPCLIRKD